MCIALVGRLAMNAGAISTGEYEFDASAARAAGRFSVDIPGNAFFYSGYEFPTGGGRDCDYILYTKIFLLFTFCYASVLFNVCSIENWKFSLVWFQIRTLNI